MSRRLAEMAALILGVEFVIMFFLFPSWIAYAAGFAIALALVGFALLIGGLILAAPFLALLELVNWTFGRPDTISGLQHRAEAGAPSKGGKHD